jgi:hypothetical protein
MSAALFDLDEVMREVRAAAGLARPATVATPLHNGPLCSKVAVVAGSLAPDLRAHLRQIQSTPCPSGFSPQRWVVVRESADRFAQHWAAQAMALGWGYDELFGVVEPFANVSLQGAAWFVGDKAITAVTADAITLRTPAGAVQRIYRRNRL